MLNKLISIDEQHWFSMVCFDNVINISYKRAPIMLNKHFV